ncbi:MAG TPA: SRPBCC family protein [Rhizomicrobium sp.]|nr:SRPBCC family protein [Rhizomicrobium sp.]
MSESKFLYVTYIRTTAEKLWDALTQPEFTRTYWSGTTQNSEWKVGASWNIRTPDGRIFDTGEILEVDRPRRLVLTWRNEHFPEMKAEGFTRLTYEIEPFGEDAVKLTLTHQIGIPGAKVIAAVSTGWPAILASLKSLLETGAPLAATTKWPENL